MARSGDVLTFVGVDALTVFVVKSFGANAVVRTVGVDAIGKLGALHIVGFALVDIFAHENIFAQPQTLRALAIDVMSGIVDAVAALAKVLNHITGAHADILAVFDFGISGGAGLARGPPGLSEIPRAAAGLLGGLELEGVAASVRGNIVRPEAGAHAVVLALAPVLRENVVFWAHAVVRADFVDA